MARAHRESLLHPVPVADESTVTQNSTPLSSGAAPRLCQRGRGAFVPGLLALTLTIDRSEPVRTLQES